MGFMQNCKVTFNGTDLTTLGLVNVELGKTVKPHIFAANKNIQTAKALYAKRNIITGFNREPITFNLTFGGKSTTITESYCNTLFKLFDVCEYKPLIFGTYATDTVYYNAMPMVGSASDLYLYMGSQGYVTIPFVCDAGNAWIDKTYTFVRDAETAGLAWAVNNPCNVKDKEGKYRVYPYIEIEVDEGTDYISFGLSTEITQTDEGWFTLDDISDDQTIVIDCANKQVFSSAGDNIVDSIRYDQFFFIEGGNNTINHRTLQGHQSDYTIHFYFSSPYMT